MTPAAWAATIAAGFIWIVSTLACGWFGGSALRAKRRAVGLTILAWPIVTSLVLPTLSAVLPLSGSGPAGLRVAAVVLTPMGAFLAHVLRKRYMPG